MGLKYEMFAVEMTPDELFKHLMSIDYIKDYTKKMKKWFEHENEISEELDKLRKKNTKEEITSEKFSEQLNEIMKKEPENQELKQYMGDMCSPDQKKYFLWWKSVPEINNWSLGGYSGRQGWKYFFDRRYENILLHILKEAGVNNIYLLNYHHNKDVGSVEIYTDLQDKEKRNVRALSSNENEKFHFTTKFAPRVKKECDLPLKKIHEFLGDNFDIRWEYQVGSPDITKARYVEVKKDE